MFEYMTMTGVSATHAGLHAARPLLRKPAGAPCLEEGHAHPLVRTSQHTRANMLAGKHAAIHAVMDG